MGFFITKFLFLDDKGDVLLEEDFFCKDRNRQVHYLSCARKPHPFSLDPWPHPYHLCYLEVGLLTMGCSLVRGNWNCSH